MKEAEIASLNDRHASVPPDYYDVGIRQNSFQAYWHWRRFRAIRRLLRGLRVERLLDLGCHGGYLTERLKSFTDARAVTAFDLSASAIEYARRAHPGINFAVANLERGISNPETPYDLVCAFDVLEHLVDPGRLMNEVHRVLRHGGTFLVAVPNENLLFRMIWSWWTTFGRGKVWKETHLHVFTPRALEALAVRAGFRMMTNRRIHFGMYRLSRFDRLP